MKKLLIVCLCTICLQAVFAQAYEGKTEYQKKDEDALVIEFAYPPSVVEGALADKLEKMGHKGKETKGFKTYKAITIGEISPDALDYMIKVERKSRKEKDESVVYLIMKTPGSDAAVTDTYVKDRAKSFLNNLTPQVEAFNLEKEIETQDEIVKKAEKKYTGLEDDQKDLEKKIEKLEKDLEENKSDQEKQRQEVAKQKQILEAMKGKRKI